MIIHNKLVRDNIPEIISRSGSIPHTRILSDTEYKQALRAKVIEEAHELARATLTDDILNELADIFELLSTIASVENLSINDIMIHRMKKRQSNGGFDKKIFLEAVQS